MSQTINLLSHKYRVSSAQNYISKYVCIYTRPDSLYKLIIIYIGLLRSRPTLTSRLNAVIHYALRWTDECINMCLYPLYKLNTHIGLLRLHPTLASHHNAVIYYVIKVDIHIGLASIYIHTLLINIL